MPRFATLAVILLLLGGCAQKKACIVDPDHDREYTTALEYKDFREIAAKVNDELLRNAWRLQPGAVLAIGTVINDTCCHFSTDLVTDKITEALTNSRKISVSSAVAPPRAGTEQLLRALRSIRGDTEFNPAAIPGTGTLAAPDLALSGKIIQRNIRRDNGGLQIEYHYLFTLINLHTGLQLCQPSGVIVKAITQDRPAW